MLTAALFTFAKNGKDANIHYLVDGRAIRSADTCTDVDKASSHYAGRWEPVTEDCICVVSLPWHFRKGKTIGAKNTLVVSRGGGVGKTFGDGGTVHTSVVVVVTQL